MYKGTMIKYCKICISVARLSISWTDLPLLRRHPWCPTDTLYCFTCLTQGIQHHNETNNVAPRHGSNKIAAERRCPTVTICGSSYLIMLPTVIISHTQCNIMVTPTHKKRGYYILLLGHRLSWFSFGKHTTTLCRCVCFYEPMFRRKRCYQPQRSHDVLHMYISNQAHFSTDLFSVNNIWKFISSLVFQGRMYWYVTTLKYWVYFIPE